MVKKYLRSLSLTLLSPSRVSTSKMKGQGSSSLPARFNPFISRLNDQIQSLKSSLQVQSSQINPADILSKLQDVHDCLDDLLHQPESNAPIHRRSPCTFRLLDDFLLLTDAFATLLRNAVLLKDAYSATRAAVRRGVESELRACIRDWKTVVKEIRKISSSVRGVGRWREVGMEEDEVEAVVRKVVEATAMTTVAVVAEVVGMSMEVVVGLGSGSGSCLMGWGPGRKEVFGKMEMREEATEKLERVGEVAAEVERRSEGLYRSLINTRVFLLNASTPL